MKRNSERWRAIEARLGREMNIWVATVRPDGRPHLAPVWFVWLDGYLYFATGSETRKFANLQANEQIALSLTDADCVVIIEGEARPAPRITTELLADYFFHKYEWDFRYDESAAWRLIEVTPRKVLAWGDGYEDEGTRVMRET